MGLLCTVLELRHCVCYSDGAPHGVGMGKWKPMPVPVHFFLYKSLLAICHAPWSPTVTWACFLPVSLPRYFCHLVSIVLSRPLRCTCVLLNCFMHLEQFVSLRAVVFLPQEICVSILYEEIWLRSSLLESLALHSEVCTHEYRSERLSKTPEQIYGTITWVRAGWLMIGESYFTIQQLPATRFESI